MRHSILYYARLIWVKSMHLGAMSGCHQLPERSFFIKQYQFPVCARCCGVVIGELLALISFLKNKKSFHPVVYFTYASFMFIDWFVQYIGKAESNNGRRLITGILGGYGCWSLMLRCINKLLKKSP